MKLNLDLDDLTVESFSTEASDAASQGTVHGQIEAGDPQPLSPGCVETAFEFTCIDCHSFVQTECPGLATCDDARTDELQCYQDTLADPCLGVE
jgi:hypothetical protein